MSANLTNRTVELERAAFLNLHARKGTTIASAGGLVWVTLEGDRDDHWLPVGESWVAPRAGHLVIEAAQRSRVVIEQPAPAAPRAGWGARLRRWWPQPATAAGSSLSRSPRPSA